MSNIISDVEQILQKEFPNSQIKFIDPRQDGKHFDLEIISEKFEGLNRVKRSQLVYKHLNDWLGTGKIHAITMKLTTPNE